MFKDLVDLYGLPSPYVVWIDVSEDIVKRRLVKRHRKDDTAALISERLDLYNRQTAPVIEYYQQNQSTINLIKVDGELTSDEVHKQIIKELGL